MRAIVIVQSPDVQKIELRRFEGSEIDHLSFHVASILNAAILLGLYPFEVKVSITASNESGRV